MRRPRDLVLLVATATVIVVFRVVMPVLSEEPARIGPGVALAPAGQGSPAPEVPTRPGVYLVPMDATSSVRLRRVAKALSTRFDLRVRVLPRMRSEVGDYDRGREQLVGDSLLRRVQETYSARRPPVAFIAVTDGDLYWAETDWSFAFGVKDSAHAVISSARMDPENLGGDPSEELLDRRLRKMVARYVGELYFDLPRSENPRSVLGPALAGVEELDAMGEEFCPPRPGERISC